MVVNIRIPVPLRNLTQGKELVACEGATVAALIDDLDKHFPGVKSRICDDTGKPRRFVNIYINEEDIRFLNGVDSPVKDSDDISIIPAIAGGCD